LQVAYPIVDGVQGKTRPGGALHYGVGHRFN
jgi:hypothetical protein